MKLLHCRMPGGNFGDDLNEWFWERIAPGLIDRQGEDTLIGIGTLLQAYHTDVIPMQARKYVLGAGAGSKGRLPVFDASWTIHGVRGPLTASYFDLPPERVVGDPAIMVGHFDELRSGQPRAGIGFMPHVWSLEDWDWEKTCQRLGLVFVDPRADSKATIRQISSLDKLLTEAMHGAIVADSLRVPWVAVALSPRFEPSKWCDWAGSLGIDLHFRHLPRLVGRDPSCGEVVRSWAKTVAMAAGRNVNYPEPRISTSRDVAISKRTLAELARRAPSQLSTDARLQSLGTRFMDGVTRLRDELALEPDNQREVLRSYNGART